MDTEFHDYDMERPDFERHNKGIHPHFYIHREPRYDKDGAPILDATGKPDEFELELCKLTVAGDEFSEIVVPARDPSSPMSPHIRFAAAYSNFKAGLEEASVGTLLCDWEVPGLTSRAIRDFRELNILSVEDLAAVSDTYITKIFDGRSWRARAEEWLKQHPSRKEEKEMARLRDENEKLVSRLEMLEKNFSSLAATKPPRKKQQRRRRTDAPRGVTVIDTSVKEVA